MRQQRLDPAVGGQDLGAADVASGRVALLRGGQVLPQLARDAVNVPRPNMV